MMMLQGSLICYFKNTKNSRLRTAPNFKNYTQETYSKQLQRTNQSCFRKESSLISLFLTGESLFLYRGLYAVLHTPGYQSLREQPLYNSKISAKNTKFSGRLSYLSHLQLHTLTDNTTPYCRVRSPSICSLELQSKTIPRRPSVALQPPQCANLGQCLSTRSFSRTLNI